MLCAIADFVALARKRSIVRSFCFISRCCQHRQMICKQSNNYYLLHKEILQFYGSRKFVQVTKATLCSNGSDWLPLLCFVFSNWARSALRTGVSLVFWALLITFAFRHGKLRWRWFHHGSCPRDGSVHKVGQVFRSTVLRYCFTGIFLFTAQHPLRLWSKVFCTLFRKILAKFVAKRISG